MRPQSPLMPAKSHSLKSSTCPEVTPLNRLTGTQSSFFCAQPTESAARAPITYGSTAAQLSVHRTVRTPTAPQTAPKQQTTAQIPDKSSSSIKNILGKVGRAARFIVTLPFKIVGFFCGCYIPSSMQ